MARRFTPFYQSLANRGMKNTNKSIGNLNTFPGNSYGFGNQGGGNIYDPGHWGGEGLPDEQEVPGGPGVGGWYNPWGPNPDYEPGTYNPDLGFADNLPGSIIKDWNVEPPKFFTPDYLSPPGDIGNKEPDLINPPNDELPEGYEWRWVNGNWEPAPILADVSDLGFGPGWSNEPGPWDLGNIFPGESVLPPGESPWETIDDIRPAEHILEPGQYPWETIDDISAGDNVLHPEDYPEDYTEGDYLTEPEKEGIPMPDDELPQGWEWQWVDGNWEPVQVSGEGEEGSPELDFPGGTGTGTGTELNIPPNYQEDNPFLGQKWDLHETMEGGFDINNDGIIDMRDYELAQSEGQGPGTGPPIGDNFFDWLSNTQYEGGQEGFMDWWSSFNQEQQDAFSSAWQDQLEPGSAPYEQEFLENLLNYINKPQIAAQQFTGGGGQGGQAARQLYYPGTSGGFASVGSGIGGGNTLDELLKQLRG